MGTTVASAANVIYLLSSVVTVFMTHVWKPAISEYISLYPVVTL